MHQDPRNNPSYAWFAQRQKAKQGDELSRVAEELAKLKRFGAPEGGFKSVPTTIPAPVAPPVRPILPVVLPGEKRQSELKLPAFVPPPPPAPAPPPEPVARRIGPAPTRGIKVKNTLQLATALEQARPGDMILLDDGEYLMPNKRYTLKGTAERPITLAAAGTGAVLTGGNNPHTLQLDRCEHVIINGLRFAPRGAQTARAINVTDGNHVTIAGCWIGAGAEGKDLAPVHFGSDNSGRYNNHNQVVGNVIYARGSAAVHFGPGGGMGARVLDNELRAIGAEGTFAALVAFTPGGMAVYRHVVLRGNRLVAEGPAGAGIALAGVSGADVSGNAIRLVRDAVGQAGAMLEIRSEGQVSGLVVHHNEFEYDRPGTGRAPFGFAGPAQVTFAENAGLYLGTLLADGKFAGLVDPAAGVHEAI